MNYTASLIDLLSFAIIPPYSGPVVDAIKQAVPSFGVIGSGVLLALFGVFVFFALTYLTALLRRVYEASNRN